MEPSGRRMTALLNPSAYVSDDLEEWTPLPFTQANRIPFILGLVFVESSV